jgi:hypothetical protein
MGSQHKVGVTEPDVLSLVRDTAQLGGGLPAAEPYERLAGAHLVPGDHQQGARRVAPGVHPAQPFQSRGKHAPFTICHSAAASPLTLRIFLSNASCRQLLANPDRRKRIELLNKVLELGRTLKDLQLQEEAEVSSHTQPPLSVA